MNLHKLFARASSLPGLPLHGGTVRLLSERGNVVIAPTSLPHATPAHVPPSPQTDISRPTMRKTCFLTLPPIED